jgi:hypothetical protein
MSLEVVVVGVGEAGISMTSVYKLDDALVCSLYVASNEIPKSMSVTIAFLLDDNAYRRLVLDSLSLLF